MKAAIQESQRAEAQLTLLLDEVEQEPQRAIYCNDRILEHLRRLRHELLARGLSITDTQDLEERWRRLNRQTPKGHQVRHLINASRKAIEDLSELAEKQQKKNLAHQIRNTLQKLFVSDNRETILHWETFQELRDHLKQQLLKGTPVANTIKNHAETIQEWAGRFQEVVFLIKEDEEKAYKALKMRTPLKALNSLGSSIEAMLQDIATEIDAWEMEQGLY